MRISSMVVVMAIVMALITGLVVINKASKMLENVGSKMRLVGQFQVDCPSADGVKHIYYEADKPVQPEDEAALCG